MVTIRCEDVSVTFQTAGGAVRALGGISLETGPSEFVAIAGPSGSGKTTLLRLIAGLVRPTSGWLELSGALPGPGGCIRTVFQEHNLFPWLNTLDNATFGLRMAGVTAADAAARALPLFQRMGLAGRESAWPAELSTGTRQRVAVIRAFLSDPSMLLMDEPFGAVDAQTRTTLQQELLELWTATRVPVVFVTHDIDEAILLAQRVIVLEGSPGRVHSEHRIPFGYPRPFELTMTPEFIDIKRGIHAGLGMRWEPAHAR
ncbi:MAG: ABC transporter ATP-binding protein [Acidobacteria bacterium]|nr:ABC transporter ATP-binding protein [Acidobacteriota bacterium]